MTEKIGVERRLIDSFKELALTVPVEKITIKEITDKAGVIRTTFYNHFQDKYMLMEKLFYEDIIKPVKPLLDNDMVDETLLLIFKNLQKEKALYTRLSHTSGQNSFEQIIRGLIRDMLIDYMNQRTSPAQLQLIRQKYRWLTLDNIADYYAQSMSFVAISWIQSSTDATPEEVAGIFDVILTSSLKDFLNNLA